MRKFRQATNVELGKFGNPHIEHDGLERSSEVPHPGDIIKIVEGEKKGEMGIVKSCDKKGNIIVCFEDGDEMAFAPNKYEPTREEFNTELRDGLLKTLSKR